MFDERAPEMQQAYQAARASFRRFWRELSWERRRIVPGLEMAMVKLPFTDGPRTDGNTEFEHPSMAKTIDDDGWSILHHEALAGNLGVVRLLIEFGADCAARTPSGYTAADLARKLGWSEIAELIHS